APDNLEELSDTVDACLEHDLLVFSGGSSVGERDLTLDVMRRKGEILFHGIAVKPGKPTVFGTIGATPVAAEQRLTRPFGETSLVAQSARQSERAAGTVNTAQPRVNAMLLRHSEFTARHSSQGMMPYARLVSMDARNGAR
ncbi:MAG: hypothetical protein JKY64_07305, partial [Alcanivorax sp.]|nr:hypothetical protein [Alcanivorax sp.]